MEEENAKKEGVLLKCFVGLTILIVILGTAIVFTKLVNDGTIKLPGSQSQEAEKPPIDVLSDIKEDYDNYNDSLDDTISKYEQELQSGSDDKKIEVAIEYAKFTFKNNQNLSEAISIMDRVKPIVENSDKKIRYYEALRTLCTDAGNDECAKNYDSIVTELIDEPEEFATEETK